MPEKPTTTASAAGPSQTHVPSQASSSSMAAPATQAHQGQTQASSQAFSQGTQQLSQNQGSDISRELPTGQGALRYEAELSPARADRPNPQNRLFHVNITILNVKITPLLQSHQHFITSRVPLPTLMTTTTDFSWVQVLSRDQTNKVINAQLQRASVLPGAVSPPEFA